MKKFIQFFSVLSLVLVFSAMAAQAQSLYNYQAEIPFDFNVGEKSYQAGNYVISVSKLSLNNFSLTLKDDEKNILQTMFVRSRENDSKDAPRLTFARNDGQRTLSEIVLQGMDLPVVRSKDKKETLKIRESAVNLKERGKPETNTPTITVASN